MKIKNKTIKIKTKETFDFINLTEEIKKFVGDSGVKAGFINIQSLHTTGAIVINEVEPLLIADIKANLERLFPQTAEYSHDNFEIRTVNMCSGECANGHSHCKAFVLPTSVVLNIQDGNICFGTWQQIFFIELDRSRDRQVSIQIIGE